MCQFAGIRSLFFYILHISCRWMHYYHFVWCAFSSPNSMVFIFLSEENGPTNKYCKWALHYEIFTFVEKYWNICILTKHTKPPHFMAIMPSYIQFVLFVDQSYFRIFHFFVLPCPCLCPFACGILFGIHHSCSHCFGIVSWYLVKPKPLYVNKYIHSLKGVGVFHVHFFFLSFSAFQKIAHFPSALSLSVGIV